MGVSTHWHPSGRTAACCAHHTTNSNRKRFLEKKEAGVEMKGGGERSPNHASFLRSAHAYIVHPVSQMHIKSVCTSAVCTPCLQMCKMARTCAPLHSICYKMARTCAPFTGSYHPWHAYSTPLEGENSTGKMVRTSLKTTPNPGRHHHGYPENAGHGILGTKMSPDQQR